MGEQKRRSYWLALMCLLIAVPGFAEPPNVEMSMEHHLTASGDTLLVDIRLEHDDPAFAPVSGVGFEFQFAPLAYRLLRVDATDAFGSDTLMFIAERSDEGRLAASMVQKQGAGVRGEATLFRIRLLALPSTDIREHLFQLTDTELLLSDGTLVRGEPTDEAAVLAPMVVWPGDTNRDGRVDETDVLRIAHFLGLEGPARADTIMRFAPTASMPWIVDAATHADVDGNGRVDADDVRAVATLATDDLPDQDIVARIFLPLAQPGDRVQLELAYPGSLMGVAAKLRIPAPLQQSEGPDTSPWTASLPIVSYLRHHPENGVVGVSVSRVRGESPLLDGESRLRLSFDLPDGLQTPHVIELLSASAMDAFGDVHRVEPLSSVLLLTDVDRADSERPFTLRLHPNHPNPFNPATVIRYDVADAGRIRLSIVDLAGRDIAVLADTHHDVGTHTVTFDATRFASGVYVCRLQSESEERIRKITLIK